MTTISAGATAGLLVALMVVSTSESDGLECQPPKPGQGIGHPGAAGSFNPQPDPPRAMAGRVVQLGR